MKVSKHIILASAVLLLIACTKKLNPLVEGADLYIRTNAYATADIFYVCSTETTDWINSQGDTIHFADMTNPAHRAALYSEMRGVDSLVCPEICNFFAPYYNQATLEGLLRE